MFYKYMFQDCYLALFVFLGQGLVFFEDRLATLDCSLVTKQL